MKKSLYKTTDIYPAFYQESEFSMEDMDSLSVLLNSVSNAVKSSSKKKKKFKSRKMNKSTKKKRDDIRIQELPFTF